MHELIRKLLNKSFENKTKYFPKSLNTQPGFDADRLPEGNPVKGVVQDPAPWALNVDAPSMGARPDRR